MKRETRPTKSLMNGKYALVAEGSERGVLLWETTVPPTADCLYWLLSLYPTDYPHSSKHYDLFIVH
jgi:hypothetical protein